MHLHSILETAAKTLFEELIGAKPPPEDPKEARAAEKAGPLVLTEDDVRQVLSTHPLLRAAHFRLRRRTSSSAKGGISGITTPPPAAASVFATNTVADTTTTTTTTAAAAAAAAAAARGGTRCRSRLSAALLEAAVPSSGRSRLRHSRLYNHQKYRHHRQRLHHHHRNDVAALATTTNNLTSGTTTTTTATATTATSTTTNTGGATPHLHDALLVDDAPDEAVLTAARDAGWLEPEAEICAPGVVHPKQPLREEALHKVFFDAHVHVQYDAGQQTTTE